MLHCPTSLSRMLMKEIAGNWKLPETVRDALDIIYISCNVQGYIPIAYMYVHETCTYIIHMWLYNICLKIYHQIQRKTENGVLFTLHPLPIMPLAGIFVTSLKVRKKQVVSSALRLCFLTWWLQGLCMKLFTLGDFRSPWFVSCTQNSHAGSLLILCLYLRLWSQVCFVFREASTFWRQKLPSMAPDVDRFVFMLLSQSRSNLVAV